MRDPLPASFRSPPRTCRGDGDEYGDTREPGDLFFDRMKASRFCLAGASIASVVGILAACVGEDPALTQSPGDGGPAADATAAVDGDGTKEPDAGGAGQVDAAGPRCQKDGDFGTPEILPGLSSPGRDYHTSSLRRGLDALYFSSDRHSPSTVGDVSRLDLYSTLPLPDGGFAPFQQLTSISSSSTDDVSPTESSDGHTLYFGTGDPERRIKRAVRQGLDQGYGVTDATWPALLRPDSTRETDPYLVGSHLYFAALAGADAAATSGLFVVTVGASGPIGEAARVPGLFAGDLRFPVVNAAETELYFARSVGDGQVPYRATRGSSGIAFKEPSRMYVTPLEQILTPTGLSADECELYLAGRDASERFVVYVARRPAP